MDYCFEFNGKKGYVNVKCYFYSVNEQTMKGICRLGNFEFDIPLKEEELINGQYILCDKCPDKNQTK